MKQLLAAVCLLLSSTAFADYKYYIGIYNPKSGDTLTYKEFLTSSSVRVQKDSVAAEVFGFSVRLDMDCYYRRMSHSTICTVQAPGSSRDKLFEINGECHTHRESHYEWMLFCSSYPFKHVDRDVQDYLIDVLKLEFKNALKNFRNF